MFNREFSIAFLYQSLKKIHLAMNYRKANPMERNLVRVNSQPSLPRFRRLLPVAGTLSVPVPSPGCRSRAKP